jgi:hypothetical protein
MMESRSKRFNNTRLNRNISVVSMPFKFLCRCITSVYQGQYWTNTEQMD